jgi:hypothetical protein
LHSVPELLNLRGQNVLDTLFKFKRNATVNDKTKYDKFWLNDALLFRLSEKIRDYYEDQIHNMLFVARYHFKYILDKSVRSSTSKILAVIHTHNRRVNLVTNPVISREWGKDREVLTTSGTYPWSFVTQIFHNGQPSHGGKLYIELWLFIIIKG